MYILHKKPLNNIVPNLLFNNVFIYVISFAMLGITFIQFLYLKIVILNQKKKKNQECRLIGFQNCKQYICIYSINGPISIETSLRITHFYVIEKI